MNSPPFSLPLFKAIIVSLTLLPIAALVALTPSLKLLPVYWPESIVEHIYPDGSIRLTSSGKRLHDDGVVRSRPLEVARIHWKDGSVQLGYLLSASGPGMDEERGVAADYWQPESSCEFSWKSGDGRIHSASCDQLHAVVRPNRMHARQRLALAVRWIWQHSISARTIHEPAVATRLEAP